ncbi:Shikimate kinase 1 [Buchnera aphidicola (Tetraneura ulmi)]|uniref:shikimate kinase AroK n=1 Tax=Buchnera aphidicola TaxID=9 RepID=UPI003464C4AC
MAEKRNIFLIGPMGAGKSTIGRYLAKQLNMEFYDSDQEIENRTGVDISWVFDLEGEIGFRKREKNIINELTKKKGIVLATGGGSIILKESRNFLSGRGIVIYLKTSIEKQIIRTQKDKKRPLLQKDNSSTSIRTVLENLAIVRNPWYEEIADVTISTDYKSARSVAYFIFQSLEKK